MNPKKMRGVIAAGVIALGGVALVAPATPASATAPCNHYVDEFANSPGTLYWGQVDHNLGVYPYNDGYPTSTCNMATTHWQVKDPAVSLNGSFTCVVQESYPSMTATVKKYGTSTAYTTVASVRSHCASLVQFS